jgi:peptidoglycan/LPS O-acetylase OafA/YrhL
MDGNAQLKYIPGLDALRGVSCLVVLFFHSDYSTKFEAPYVPFKGGFMGVDIFFVLSGYLITTILLNQFAQRSTINFKNFYIKRILRLYPPILISVSLFFIPLLFTDRPAALSNIISLVTYTGDMAMVVQHFTHLPYPLASGHSWSLAVEEQFYLTFPLLLFLVLRYNSRKKQSNAIAFFPLFLVLYFLVVIVSSIILGKWFYKFFLWRFFEIYLGAFIAVIYSESFLKIAKDTAISSRVRNIVYKIYGNGIVLLMSMLFLLVLVVYPYQMPLMNYLAQYNLHYVLFTIAGSVLIVNIVYPRHPFLVKMFSNKILVFFGTISYGMYLYTPFVSEALDSILFHGKVPFENATMRIVIDVVKIVAGILFSYLSYTFIEKKILRLKGRLEPKVGDPVTPNPLAYLPD